MPQDPHHSLALPIHKINLLRVRFSHYTGFLICIQACTCGFPRK